MLKLSLHKDALKDLDDLWEQDPDTAADLEVFLEELSLSQDLMDRLTQHNFGSSRYIEPFHVAKWEDQQRRDNNLWRIKFWELENVGLQYRVVYAFFPQSKHHYVLGIMPRKGRDFDYKHEDLRTQRMLRTYGELRETLR